MNFTTKFPNLEPKDKFPWGYEFMLKKAEQIIGDMDVFAKKEAADLTDAEKWAVCFFACVPMRIESGDSPEKISMVTDCDVGIQKIDGKFRVLIREKTFP